MKKIKVVSPLKHNGKLYQAGDWVEMQAEQATACPAVDETTEQAAVNSAAEPSALANPLAELVSYIAGLDVEDKALWTAEGKPELSQLSLLAGRKVSAAERDEAWDAYKLQVK